MPFVTAAGHALEYQRIEADSSKPTLVFLHEGLGSITQWRDFPQQVVAATRCPALVYARYGYGQSDMLAEQRTIDFMHAEALTALPQLLKALEISNPILVGHSDGASIALIHAGVSRTDGSVQQPGDALDEPPRKVDHQADDHQLEVPRRLRRTVGLVIDGRIFEPECSCLGPDHAHRGQHPPAARACTVRLHRVGRKVSSAVVAPWHAATLPRHRSTETTAEGR